MFDSRFNWRKDLNLAVISTTTGQALTIGSNFRRSKIGNFNVWLAQVGLR